MTIRYLSGVFSEFSFFARPSLQEKVSTICLSFLIGASAFIAITFVFAINGASAPFAITLGTITGFFMALAALIAQLCPAELWTHQPHARSRG